MKIKTKTYNLKPTSAFTLVELVVVLGIILTLLALAVINLTQAKNSASLSTSITTFVTDVKSQQTKSMIGDTEGRASPDYYGVHFSTNTYELFHGSTFASASASTVPLGDQVQIVSTTFPSSQVVFNKGTGEVVGFVNGSNTIVIRNIQSNQQKTITINRYGVVTSVN